MAKYLIVDGHSMIFAWEDLRQLHQKNTERARRELIDRLTRYQDLTGTHVVLVFDGRGERRYEPAAPESIQVFYSRAGQTADDVIERLAAKYAAEREIRVATNDGLERQTVISFGATTLNSEDMLRELELAERDLKGALEKLRRRSSNRRSREG